MGATKASVEPGRAQRRSTSRDARRALLFWLCAMFLLAPGLVLAQSAVSCETAADCGCGPALDGSGCRIGHPSELAVPGGEDPCRNLCLEPMCVDGRCARRAAAGCPLDCDGNLLTTVDEIVLGTSIVLGVYPARACPSPWRGLPVIDVTTIVRAVDAGLQGCVATLEQVGDGAILDAELGGGDGALASVSSYDGINRHYSIKLGPNATIQFSIPIGAERGSLENATLLFTDYGTSLAGSFSVESDSSAQLVRIELEPANAPIQLPREIVLRQPLEPAIRPFDGTYRLTLSHDPVSGSTPTALTGTFRLSTNPLGIGLLSEMVLRNGAGDLRATISGARCAVSPAGYLSCSGAYFVAGSAVASDPNPSSRLGVIDHFGLTGHIRAAEETWRGSGRYLVGVDPPFDGLYTGGSWEAERIAD